MQLASTVASNQAPEPTDNLLSLADLLRGQCARIDRLDLPDDDARRLMQLGFLPGSRIELSRRSPFGDPSVYRIDDAEIALRRETSRHILLRLED